MIKVPKLFTDETSKELILAQLVDQNPILHGMALEIDQFYQTTTYKNEKYWCLILATDLTSQTKILQKGFLLFNIAEIKIYEYVNILQCANCLRYGHFAVPVHLLHVVNAIHSTMKQLNVLQQPLSKR